MNTSNNVIKEKEKLWFLNLIGIIFFSCLAWWSYAHITTMEERGRVILNKFLSLPYMLGGKWGVVGFWMLFVLHNVISGIRKYYKENKVR
jgi:Na+-driven multidrug efflux pump